MQGELSGGKCGSVGRPEGGGGGRMTDGTRLDDRDASVLFSVIFASSLLYPFLRSFPISASLPFPSHSIHPSIHP